MAIAKDKPISCLPDLAAAAGGVLLLAGLWTPIAALVTAGIVMWMAATRHFPAEGSLLVYFMVAVQSISLAMLGPGAWSVDARLFGRRRIELRNRDR